MKRQRQPALLAVANALARNTIGKEDLLVHITTSIPTYQRLFLRRF